MMNTRPDEVALIEQPAPRRRADLNSDIIIKYCFLKLILLEHKPLWAFLVLRHAKSGFFQGESTLENSIFISMSEVRSGSL